MERKKEAGGKEKRDLLGDGHAISIPPHKVIKLKHVPLEQPQIPVELSSTQMRVKFFLLFYAICLAAVQILLKIKTNVPKICPNKNKIWAWNRSKFGRIFGQIIFCMEQVTQIFDLRQI